MKTGAIFLAVALPLSACALFGPSKEDDPRNVETPTDRCAPDQTQTVLAASLFSGPNQVSSTRPVRGSVVALEGVPRSKMICSQRGCDSECCNNGCGADAECPYALRVDDTNEVCLANGTFECGGTDCKSYCAPFGQSPQQRYRFIGVIEYRAASLGQTPLLEVQRWCVVP